AMTGQGQPSGSVERAVPPELEAEVDVGPSSPVSQEGQVERGAVPAHEDARLELLEVVVDGGQDPGLLAGEDHVTVVLGRDRDGKHPGHSRIKTIDRGVRLDVEAVESLRHGCDCKERV